MAEHLWAIAAVVRIDAERAAEVAAMDLPTRLERIAELFPPVAPGQVTSPIEAVRGPICEECRVHWRDVHAEAGRPWPCPGRRPEKLGGPLVTEDRRTSRQQRRQQRRAASTPDRPKGALPRPTDPVEVGSRVADALALATRRTHSRSKAWDAEPARVRFADPRPALPEPARI